jgi:hypothetical protein
MGIQTLLPAAESNQSFIPSAEEAGGGSVPTPGITFPVVSADEGLVVAENFPPTLGWVTGKIRSTLVSNRNKEETPDAKRGIRPGKG